MMHDHPHFDRRLGRALLCLGAWLACGCGTSDADPNASITPPQCSSVTHFGNGLSCENDDGALSSCGTSASRTCASGWLCFDAPQYVDCGCAADSDCATRLAYINDARASVKKAPITSACVKGRCSGRP